MALKRLIILIVSVLAAVPAAAYAENISVKEGVYISKPEISCGGEIIREFAAQTDYGDVGVKLTAESTGGETVPVTVTAAFYNGGVISSVDTDTQIVGREPVSFELALSNISADDENSMLKVFVWKDMEPYAEAAEIGVSAEPQTVEEADMEIIRARIEQDSGLRCV